MDQPDADSARAVVHEEDVYQPVIDGGCEPQADIRVDDEFFVILGDITDELFMSEVDTHVQGSAPTEAASETVVGEVPQQFFQDDLYRPSFEYALDGCHLHNEGYMTKDEDDEVGHFMSLANMCRDKQLFTSFYESLCQQHQPTQQHQSDEPETG